MWTSRAAKTSYSNGSGYHWYIVLRFLKSLNKSLVKNLKEIKQTIEQGKIAKCNFCSTKKDGEKCAETIEKDVGAEVRGTQLNEKQKPTKENCIICGKKAEHIVYIAKAY